MTALVTVGWRIVSVANTATKEHGIDVVAALNGETAGVEVKGVSEPQLRGSWPSWSGEANQSEYSSWPLVRPSRACCNAAAEQGANVAECDRAAGLLPIPRTPRPNGRIAVRCADRSVVDRSDRCADWTLIGRGRCTLAAERRAMHLAIGGVSREETDRHDF